MLRFKVKIIETIPIYKIERNNNNNNNNNAINVKEKMHIVNT